ncbi:Development/cell death domain [Dillenia turbinata]|uniref:Development/cell death domain n=1 Tax=Dillenia turbinata TaxID=194707 RepID=A0AAN8W7D9_9MAGN
MEKGKEKVWARLLKLPGIYVCNKLLQMDWFHLAVLVSAEMTCLGMVQVLDLEGFLMCRINPFHFFLLLLSPSSLHALTADLFFTLAYCLRMVAGKNIQKPANVYLVNNVPSARNLKKANLGGVIFGCTHNTIKECLFKQLFGLPAQHISYVKNIEPGLPVFLFNYSDRKLHGIFEAASPGQMNIDPYAWTDGSKRTTFPAQVQICVRKQCQPLLEQQFKPVIEDNYFGVKHLWFELDHFQTSKLLSLLSSSAAASSPSQPQNLDKRKIILQPLPWIDPRVKNQGLVPDGQSLEVSLSGPSELKVISADVSQSVDRDGQPLETDMNKQAMEQNEKEDILNKLRYLVRLRKESNSSFMGCKEDSVLKNDKYVEGNSQIVAEEKNDCTLASSSDQLHNAQLEIKELKASKSEQSQKINYLELKLVEYEKEIQRLKYRCKMLESGSAMSIDSIEESTNEPLDVNDSIYLVGGYDGTSWLSNLDIYSPSQNVVRSLKPMSSFRAYASTVKFDDKFIIFGGGSDCVWYDTVESYSPTNNEWTLCPSLHTKKGSLGGATLNNKVFAVGGGNGVECFSEVEMFDLDAERWIHARSMLEKRFALAAAELNGVLYAVGGYDGNDYLSSAERFDPRGHSWTKIGRMNVKRGCHSLAVLNEKMIETQLVFWLILMGSENRVDMGSSGHFVDPNICDESGNAFVRYVLGGYDGSNTVSTVEIYEPRMDSWMAGVPMNHPRGYFAAAVIRDSLYVVGGMKDDTNLLETVERYQEGQGWDVLNAGVIGKRCFLSGTVL